MDALFVGPYHSINPYCQELGDALAAHPNIGRLARGPLQFWHGKGPFDVIHLHFPELLTHYRAPSSTQLEKIESRLAWWRSQGSTIAVTLHDWASHNTSGTGFDELFETVFGAADLIIHLGTASAAEATAAEWCTRADHVVIPHHLFTSFGPPVPKEEARRELGLADASSILVVAQTIRTVDEVDLIDAAAAGVDVVVVAATAQVFDPVTAAAVSDAVRRLDARPGIRLHHQMLSNARLARVVSAGDVMLVARTRPCNSSGVALGTGLGRLVVGTNVGNVGSSLRELGNPTFDPRDRSALVDAVRSGVELAAAGHGARAFEYATTSWSVSRVADLHVGAYSDARRRPART